MSTTVAAARPHATARRYRLHLLAHLPSSSVQFALLIVLGAGLRLWMLARDVPTLNSDEATIGLMALHMSRGEWTTFFWGQEYMGSLEAVLAAPFLALFGTNALSLHLASLLVGLAFIATTYLLAVRIYGRHIALSSAALLAFGPPFFVVTSMRTLGGYPETLFFGNLVLLLALGGGTRRGRSPWRCALLGGIAGLAVWTDPLIIPYLLAAGVICWAQRRTDLYGRNGLLLGAGVCVGAGPAILYNITHGAATVGWVLGLTVLGGHSSSPLLTAIPGNFWHTIVVALPILAGSPVGGTQVNGLTSREYLAAAASAPGMYVPALALAILTVALVGGAVLRALRGWRTLRCPAGWPASEARECDPAYVRRQGEAALLLVLISTLAAFCLSRQPEIATAPRYLLPIYAGIPLIVAQARRLLGWLCHLLGPSSQRLVPHRRVGIAALLLICVWNVAGDLTLTPLRTASRDHGIWVVGSDDPLLRTFSTDRVHTVISNDYWEGLRLTFESDETILTVMMTSPGHLGFNRYQPYVSEGLADQRPAYLELTGTQEASRNIMRWRAGWLPGYSLALVDSYTVLLPPPPE